MILHEFTFENGYHSTTFVLYSFDLRWVVQAASTTSASVSFIIHPCPFWYPSKKPGPHDPASPASGGSIVVSLTTPVTED